MSLHLLEPHANTPSDLPPRRRHHAPEDALHLTELRADAVIDHLDDQAPVNLTTFGTVRETCPKCLHTHLRLVLRQSAVRTAHLFCTECHSCFDARYANGNSALTI